MKCPFRKTTRYQKLQNFTRPRQEGGFDHYSKIIPCSEHECDTKVDDFADCLQTECPYYYKINNVENCKKIKENNNG